MNMTIHGTSDENDSFGLIKKLVGKGTVQNLVLTNIKIDISNTSGGLKIGGIAAESAMTPSWDPEIKNCFVTGEISSQNSDIISVGGIAGYSYGLTIQDCYSDVTIDTKGGGHAGGIAGRSGYMDGYGDIRRCYAAGSITGNYETANMIGGSACQDCYYLKTSGSDNRAEGLTKAQMQKAACFTGFDFEKIWYVDEAAGYSYPQLKNCPQARISSCELTTLPSRLTYTMDDVNSKKLDLSGGVLTLTYEDGIKAPIALENSMITEIRQKQEDDPKIWVVSLSYSNAEASFDITVSEVSPDSIKLNKKICELNRGEKVKLTAIIEPEQAADCSITWKSSNEQAAVVSADGTVKGLNAGTAKITASTENGLTASCTITVNVPAKKIKLSVSSLVLKKGQKKKVTVVTTPLDTTDVIIWSSSSPKIVKVNNKGFITAKKQGSATVTAQTKSGLAKKVKVTVKA